MPPPRRLSVLRVFLASPSDLQAERQAAKEAVDRLNRTFREWGWVVELLGWEDRLPGFGRPQSQINEDVDACDLFLGVLWRRWGSPSGRFRSGFEEEFERAVNRRRQSESPEIWIYFKRVEDPSDPGEQLRQVIAFREKLAQQRELLYMEFRDTSDWSAVCHDALLKYVLKRAFPGEIRSVELTAAKTPARYPGGTMPAGLPESTQELPEQLRRVTLTVGTAASDFGSPQFNARLMALANVDLVRLHLLGASLVYARISQDTLSNHAVNLVYRYRDALGNLTDPEARLVLASLLREGNTNVPGWYWVKDTSDEQIAQWIETIAMDDPDGQVRTSAFELLSSRPTVPGMTRTRDLLAAALDEPSEEMRGAALNYSAHYGDSGTADIINDRLGDLAGALEHRAIAAIVQILMRCDPTLALDRLLQTSGEPDGELLSLVRAAADTFDEATLRRMLEHESSGLRVMAADRLARQDLLTAGEAKTLLSDSSTGLRAVGIRRLIVLGERLAPNEIRELLVSESKTQAATMSLWTRVAEDLPNADDLVEELFSTLSYDELLPLVSWFTQDGSIAYKVLGLHYFDRFGERVRTDMAERFATFHGREKDNMRARFLAAVDQGGQPAGVSVDTMTLRAEAAAEKAVKDWAGVDSFVRATFLQAGLTALARNGSVGDLAIGRQYLDSRDPGHAEAALELVCRFGDDSDVEPLLALATREYGRISERAAKEALALSPDPWMQARQYLERERMPFVRLGIEALAEHSELSSKWRQLIRYLFASDANVRQGTARLLAGCLDDGELVELVNLCHEAETYYYDVVTIFDRALYGPAAWRTV